MSIETLASNTENNGIKTVCAWLRVLQKLRNLPALGLRAFSGIVSAFFQSRPFKSQFSLRRSALGVFVSSAFLGVSTPALAQLVGQPDPTFNGSGVLVASLFPGTIEQRFADMVVQPDGKTVVVASCNTTGGQLPSVDDGWGFCAFRYNLDGAVDTTFGVNGRWKARDRNSPSSLQTYDSFANSVALQSDGSIVIAGVCRNNEGCLALLTPAGLSASVFRRVSATFISNFAGSPIKVAIQSDKKILLVAVVNAQPAVARFSALGVLDSTYGTAGVASATSPTTPAGLHYYILRDAYVDPTSGKLLGVALRSLVAGSNAEIFRFDTNGAIDGTFDADGFVSVLLSSANTRADAFSFAPRADGGVEVAVLGNPGAAVEIKLGSIRRLANGAADINHGTNGLRWSSVDYAAPCQFEAAKTLPDKKTVFAGHTSVNIAGTWRAAYDVCRVRLNSDLTIDSSFDAGPTLFSSGVSYGGYDSSLKIAVGKDAKLIIADGCKPDDLSSTARNFCMQRYDYLSSDNCYDIDGDGLVNPLVDGLALVRAQLGLRGNAVTDGLGISSSAPRKDWRALREFMIFSCGMRGL